MTASTIGSISRRSWWQCRVRRDEKETRRPVSDPRRTTRSGPPRRGSPPEGPGFEERVTLSGQSRLHTPDVRTHIDRVEMGRAQPAGASAATIPPAAGVPARPVDAAVTQIQVAQFRGTSNVDPRL